MRSRFRLLLSIILITLIYASPLQASPTLTIAGDPCSVPLIKALVEAGGIDADIQNVGCSVGVYMASEGEVEMGLSTQNGLASNMPKGGINTVIARSPVVLIVNADNPVDNISYDDLKRIYSGEITNWKEIGGADMMIENVMLAPCVTLSMSKKVAKYSDSIKRLKPSGKVNPVTHTNKMVAENPAAIGQQIYGYESSEVKVLTVDGLLPTPDSLPARYSFYQDYNIITHGVPQAVAAELISFARSKKGHQVIRSLKHIPVD